jgi:phosphoinositide-3-kinase regulatory subunit 4
MGTSQSTLQVQQEDSLNVADSVETHDVLKSYRVEEGLFPGSGRMMRTYRISHREAESTAVLKAMWVNVSGREEELESQQKELQRIKEALQDQSHVAPFGAWFVGDARNTRLPTITVKPVYLLRPHVYTTLSDRLASRPWLHHVEKLWITSQILQAVEHMHKAGVVHGFLCTENIGLTSAGWVVLLDIASYKAQTALPDDDPSEYLYYFQPQNQHAADAANNNAPQVSRSEKRCYLAPERFYTPSQGSATSTKLDPAMDLFSTGCVLTELFLNGERCMDLGDLMDYRRAGQVTTAMQQKLNKIESSSLRAACRHMLHLDPAERLTAQAYRERLQASEQIPESFDSLTAVLERVTTRVLTPDASIAITAAAYRHVLWETMGVRDKEGAAYIDKVLGPTMVRGERKDANGQEDGQGDASELDKHISACPMEETQNEDLFSETEALLRELDSLVLGEEEEGVPSNDLSESDSATQPQSAVSGKDDKVERSPMCKSSLIVFLQLVLSTIRHVQRPASKLVALRLIERLARYSSDEARLQRIVPVTVSLLQDQDPLVRASAVQVLTTTVSIIQSFSPSDSKLFPQYIFKRVAHMISDPALVVRLVFASCIATLAETAHRFLDISHAVRLYEAVGSGASGSGNDDAGRGEEKDSNVFTDDVAKLLDNASQHSSRLSMAGTETSGESGKSERAVVAAGKTLIGSTYNAELTGLHETISRWVVQLSTDQSEQSSLPKRALLNDLGRLCAFFGLEGVMAFVLPQILAFLNDRKDWELRAALFEHLPSVCHIVGRAATEEFVLPCIEIGLVDSEDQVICRVLACWSKLVEMGLLSRSVIIGGLPSSTGKSGGTSLLRKYGALLLHPSQDVRLGATRIFNASCKALGSPDCEVYVVPILIPFLRFQPSSHHLTTVAGMQTCLHLPWTREEFVDELRLLIAAEDALFPTAGNWTSVGRFAEESPDEAKISKEQPIAGSQDLLQVNREGNKVQEPQLERVREYLRMLARHTAQQATNQDRGKPSRMLNGIEGSVKLAQSIMFPRHDGQIMSSSLPAWYSSLRDAVATQDSVISESAAIRSVSTLGHVYGLSIMGPAGGTSENIVGAADESQGTEDEAQSLLRAAESETIEAAFTGQWGSETLLDPDVVDTSLLVTKLNALGVPPLPTKLGEQGSSLPSRVPGKEVTAPTTWKPRINALVASSSHVTGHTAPVMKLAVSLDQSFFVSGSHDGTCRVWEIPQVEDSPGSLESNAVYSGHSEKRTTRINDVAMVEGSHSIVSGSSDSVHVWRVDMVAPAKTSFSQSETKRNYDRSRVIGTSTIREVDPAEGEILSVSHFNSASASIITFATQKGSVHSWDLRCAREPFVLRHGPDLGHLTSVALGNDRQWIVTGSSRGYLALWDVRFQQAVKLWRHSREAPITSLAASFVPPPHIWGSRAAAGEARPFVFAACGSNECAMFDIETGSCREGFRVVGGVSRDVNDAEALPLLTDIPMSPRRRSNSLLAAGQQLSSQYVPPAASINCMVGSIGAQDQSYLITGGSDSRIRFWDFSTPSKCYVVSGQSQSQPRPSFERIDFEGPRRLMLCRQPQSAGLRDSNTLPRKLFHGVKRPEQYHSDAIQDLKVIDKALLSCSRDCTVKVWR